MRSETRKKIRQEAGRMARTESPEKLKVRERNDQTADRTQKLIDMLKFEGERDTYIITSGGDRIRAPDF